MEYPTPPRSGSIRPDPVQLWGGGVATAVVAALIALVGVLVCRWMLHIAILAPSSDGAWGSAHTAEFVMTAAVVALVATGLLHLMMLATPQPTMFLGWIMGLATVVAVVYPFSTGAPLDQKMATAAVDLVLGVAITSLLTAVATRAVRSVETRRRDYDRRGPDRRGYDRRDHDGYPARDGHPARDGYPPRDGYPDGYPGRGDGYGDQEPTLRYPQERDDDRWR